MSETIKKENMEKGNEFIPSPFQSAIFDFVKNGNGNAVIEAVPGSGKSTTAVKCIDLIPKRKKVLLTAFNTDIVDELIRKIGERENVTCKTIHGLGMSILLANYHDEIDVTPNEFKYSSYIYTNIDELSDGLYEVMSQKEKDKYVRNIRQLVNFGRYYLCQTVKDLSFIENHYNLICLSNEKEVALKVMDWGKENYQTIDFTDMIWLPIVLNCKTYGKLYDWIILDECQDVQKAERELLLRCTKMSTRMLFFGERQQSLYAFMGADIRSFDEFMNIPNTQALPLSVSYRCAKNIVDFVKKFNDNMKPKDGAIDGIVKKFCSCEEIHDGDMILCRNNAPLLQMYGMLSKKGIKGYIRGKDFGDELIDCIESTNEIILGKDLKCQGLFSVLYDKLFDDIDLIMKKHEISFEIALDDINIQRNLDMIDSLLVLSDDLSTCNQLINRIEKIFAKEDCTGVSLSTIHKAKGLEADNVYICCPSLLPSKSARTAWEKEQEANLEYVAYTRPKIKLGFLDEVGFTKYTAKTKDKIKSLRDIQNLVTKIHGNPERCIATKLTTEEVQRIISKNSIEKEAKAVQLTNAMVDAKNNTDAPQTLLITPKRKNIRRL